MKLNRWVVWVSVWMLFPVPGDAAFPSGYLPNGPRPRLWLEPGSLDTYRAARGANTEAWQNYWNYCENTMTEVPWNGPQIGVPPLALLYLLTGEQRYADRALELMDMTADRAEGDVAAHGYFGYLGLGYDWLHDNPAMTPDRRQAYADKMIHWSDFVWKNENYEGRDGNGQDTDAVIETGSAHLMLGCALYGDAPEAQALLDRGWWMWEHGQGREPAPGVEQWTLAKPIRTWVADALGGHFYPGFLYFMGSDGDGLSQYWTTLRTACHYDINSLVIRAPCFLIAPPAAAWYNRVQESTRMPIIRK